MISTGNTFHNEHMTALIAYRALAEIKALRHNNEMVKSSNRLISKNNY